MRSLLACLLFASTCAAQQPAAPVVTPVVDVRPLPDLPTLIAAVERKQKRDEALEQKYIYKSTITFALLDKHGEPKPTKQLGEVDEVYWSEGVRMLRVLERGGKPLTPEQQEKESKAMQKRMAERKEKQDKKTEEGTDDRIPLSRLLELGTFSAPRRETVNGRPTIAIDFVGNPNAKTHNDNEKVVRDVTGTVWVDEQDEIVQHLQGKLLKDFKVAGGMLANIGAGTTFSTSQRRVNDELWLPDTTEMEGHFRFLLLLSAQARMNIACSDYRKFRTSSTIHVAGPVSPDETDPLGEPAASAPRP